MKKQLKGKYKSPTKKLDYTTTKIGITLFYNNPIDIEIIKELKDKMANPLLKSKVFTRTQIEHVVYNPELKHLYTKDVESMNQKISIMNFLKSVLQVYRKIKKIHVFFSDREYTHKQFSAGPHGFYFNHHVLKIHIDLSRKFKQIAGLGGVQNFIKTLHMGFYDEQIFDYIEDKFNYESNAIQLLKKIKKINKKYHILYFDNLIKQCHNVLNTHRVFMNNPVVRIT